MSAADVAVPPGDDKPSAAPEVAPSATPVPVAAAPVALREDQIQNAIAFLTHPKVRESTTATKRSFLERKGLTTPEIDEAFKRVPEPSTSNLAPSTSPSTGLITYQNQPSTTTGHAAHHAPATAATYPSGAAGVPGQYPTAIVPVQPQAIAPVAPVQEPLRWSQVLIGVGAVAAGVYALKALVLPYAQEWYSSWCERSRQQKEAQEKQTQLMIEAMESLKACQAEMKSSSDTLASCLSSLRAEQQRQQDAARDRDHSSMIKSDLLLQEFMELKTMVKQQQQQQQQPQRQEANRYGPSSSNTLGTFFGEERMHKPADMPGPAQYNRASYDTTTNGSTPWRPTTSTNNNNNMEDDGPVYPGGSRGAIPPPPGGYLGAGGYGGQRNGGGGGWGGGQGTQEGGTSTPGANGNSNGAVKEKQGEYPPSFHEVMEMVSKGITPPNVRTDIDDTPPDPTRPLPRSRGPPPPKPWEHTTASAAPSSTASSTPTVHQPDASIAAAASAAPFWQQQQQQQHVNAPPHTGSPQITNASMYNSSPGSTYGPTGRQSPSPQQGSGYGGYGGYNGNGGGSPQVQQQFSSPAGCADRDMNGGGGGGSSGAGKMDVHNGGGGGGSGVHNNGGGGSGSGVHNNGGGGGRGGFGSYSSIFTGGANRSHSSTAQSSGGYGSGASLPQAPAPPPPLSVLQPNTAWKPPPPPPSSLTNRTSSTPAAAASTGASASAPAAEGGAGAGVGIEGGASATATSGASAWQGTLVPETMASAPAGLPQGVDVLLPDYGAGVGGVGVGPDGGEGPGVVNGSEPAPLLAE